MKENIESEKEYRCCVCNIELHYIEQFKAFPCNHYCCGHCPDAKVRVCQKERYEREVKKE